MNHPIIKSNTNKPQMTEDQIACLLADSTAIAKDDQAYRVFSKNRQGVLETWLSSQSEN